MQLDLQCLRIARAGAEVVRGVSLHVGEGEIVALLGPNGAGKTSLLRCISGLEPRAASGVIRVAEKSSVRWRDITRLEPHHIVALGVAHCPEGRQILSSLSVRENLLLGACLREDRQAARDDAARIESMFPILGERADVPGTHLSGGEQMMLALGRALLSRPQLLLLDEPSLGLAPQMAQRIYAILRKLREGGVSILLVEQNVGAVLAFADRAYVMEQGAVALQGEAGALAHDPRIRHAYLGQPQ